MAAEQQRAAEYYARQAAITAAAVVALRRAFERRLPWPPILALFGAYQLAAATAAVRTMVRELGRSTVRPALFAGVSSAGYPLFEPLIATIDRIVPAPPEGLPTAWWDADIAEFWAQVEQLIASEVQDAGRSAAQAVMVELDHQNYVRVLNPPSCGRCAVLAGRIYRDLDGFERHPRCFPAGVLVAGPSSHAATRRWYEGELVVLRTASGKQLPITGNHPVLTDKGWVPAHLLQVGDGVVGASVGQTATSLVVPDEQQAPSLIEDVRGSHGMVPFGVVPTAAEDFHGDGGHGEVDVVLADRLLDRWPYTAGMHVGQELELARRVAKALGLASPRPRDQLGMGVLASPHSVVGGSGLGLSLLRGHTSGADQAGLGRVADRHACLNQALPDGVAGDPVAETQRVLALAAQVRRRHVFDRQNLDPPRWDAPTSALTVDNAPTYARIGLDLLHRLASQVTTDRIVKLERVGFRGHVYNLTSSEGWFAANGLIVSNCDCVHWPVQDWERAHDQGLVSSPEEAFERGHIRGLSKADAQAIRDGADIAQVINAHRGLYTADVLGRRLKATRMGTTRRAAWRRANPSLLVRLRPEAIYRLANGDADLARSLLKTYGYIL